MTSISGCSGGGGGGGGGGAATVFDLDWTAEPDSGALADGPITVAGQTFTVANSAAASRFEIENGVGLSVAVNTFTSVNLNAGMNGTAPMMYALLEAIDRLTRRVDLPLSIWAHYTAFSLPASSNMLVSGLGVPAPYTLATWSGGIRNSLGTPYPGGKRQSLNDHGVAVPMGSNNVILFYMPVEGVIEVLFGTWDDGWPELEDMTLGLRAGFSTGNFEDNLLARVPGATFLVGVESNGSAAVSPSFTLAHSRIQVG